MSRIGIFGGTFNPIHAGHVNSMVEVQKKLNLDEVKVIPAYQSPGRELIESPTPEQRLEMVELGLKDQYEFLEIDSREIERQGTSYTIDTLKSLMAEEVSASSEYFIIIGLDQFGSFDTWKDFKDILSSANLIVTSRMGYQFPLSKKDFPEGLQSQVAEFDGYQCLLTSGKWIHFVRLNDIDISSTEVRRKLKIGQSTDKYLALAVENFIHNNGLYDIAAPKVEDFKKFTLEVAELLDQKGALNTLAFDFTATKEYIVEYSIVCSASNKRQSGAFADHILNNMKEKYNVRPIGMDGKEDGRWIVVDYGGLIIHIFYDFVRQEYLLEQLWKGAKKLDYKATETSKTSN